MIVSRYDGRLLVVAQPDHGTQTGVIADAWGNDELPPLTQRRDSAVRAGRHHDDGWAVWERHPDLDERTSQPVQFYDVRPREHLAAYRAGIVRAAQLDPWTGLLVSMHGAGLYNDRYGSYRLEEIGEQPMSDAERLLVNEFLADMAGLQASLYETAVGHAAIRPPHELPEVMDQYLLLQVWDRISLQFAFRHAADGVISPVPSPSGRTSLRCVARGRFTLALDPYPFAVSRVDLPVLARFVTDRPYTDPEDFIAELTAATEERLDCVVLRP